MITKPKALAKLARLCLIPCQVSAQGSLERQDKLWKQQLRIKDQLQGEEKH
jgi:hypothetical protein